MSHPSWKNQNLDIPEEKASIQAMDFEISVLEALNRADPADVDALFHLGEIYTRRGLYQKGLAVDKKLAELFPDNEVVNYNLSCSYSLIGDVESAFEALDKAIGLGYREFRFIETDPDLERLRMDKRFEILMAKYHFGGADKPESRAEF